MELRFKRIAKAASSQPATNVGGGKREGGGTRWRRALCVTRGTGEKSPPSPFYIGARGDVEKLDKKARGRPLQRGGDGVRCRRGGRGSESEGKVGKFFFSKAGRKTQRHSAKQQ